MKKKDLNTSVKKKFLEGKIFLAKYTRVNMHTCILGYIYM